MSGYDLTVSDGTTSKSYIIDRASDEYRFQTIPTLRPQQDAGANPSEQSINPEIGWLRSRESWHHGAGQTFADRQESDQYRFRSSKGVNPWTKWELTLLNQTTQVLQAYVIDIASAGSRMYYTNGSSVLASTDPFAASPVWTTCSGTGAPGIIYLTTDGSYVYAGSDTGVIYRATAGSTSFSSYATGGTNPSHLAYVKGRLMCTDGGGQIFNITASGAFPAALGSFNIFWNGFCEGPNKIYVAGNQATDAGSQGIIYKIGIKTDGTGLDAPVPASPGMPRGELINAIGNYLGFIFVATSKGIRMCEPDPNGDLTVGPPIQVGDYGSTAFFGDDRFVYFAWPVYDATSWGLGRIDLQSFTDTLLPAYASDLMMPMTLTASVIPNIARITKFNGRFIWSVFNGVGAATTGLWSEDTSQKVTSGTLDTGYITYNVSDPKTPQAVDARHRPLPAGSSIVTALNVDDAGFSTVLTLDSDADDTHVSLSGYGHSEHVEMRATLNRATVITAGPTLTRLTLNCEVIVPTGSYLYIPVLLSDVDAKRGGAIKSRDVGAEITQLTTWRTDRTALTVTIGTQTYNVVLRDFEQRNHHKGFDDNEQATLLLKLKTAA